MLAEKELLLDEIKSKIDPKLGFIVMKYQNLTANAMSDFRRDMLICGGDIFIFKKRIFLKVAKDLNLKYNSKELDGHLAFLYTKKSFVEVIKALYKFKKENIDTVEVIGGYFEDNKCTSNEVEEISTLPTQDEMRAQLLGLFVSPISGVLGLFNSILTGVIYCLDNKQKD